MNLFKTCKRVMKDLATMSEGFSIQQASKSLKYATPSELTRVMLYLESQGKVKRTSTKRDAFCQCLWEVVKHEP